MPRANEHASQTPAGPLRPQRRQIVLAGLGLMLAGCSGSRQSATTGIHYRVQAGDTLPEIARRSGLTITQICEANNLSSGRLNVGQTLWLPGGKQMQRRAVSQPVVSTPKLPYALVNRAEWGARPSTPDYDPMPAITKITVHHTGAIDGMTGYNDLTMIRKIQGMHQNPKWQGGRGWADIGYHYIIGHDGRIYQGRPEHIQGAHVGGDRNKYNLGISVMGEFMTRMPTGEQMIALQALLGHKQRQLKVPNSRVFGHRDMGKTLCPGDQLYAWLQAYKSGRA